MALLPAATMVQLSRLRLPLKACFLAQVRPLAPSQRWHGCRGPKKRDPGTVQRARTVAAQQWAGTVASAVRRRAMPARAPYKIIRLYIEYGKLLSAIQNTAVLSKLLSG
jgi:hypothetical protein